MNLCATTLPYTAGLEQQQQQCQEKQVQLKLLSDHTCLMPLDESMACEKSTQRNLVRQHEVCRNHRTKLAGHQVTPACTGLRSTRCQLPDPAQAAVNSLTLPRHNYMPPGCPDKPCSSSITGSTQLHNVRLDSTVHYSSRQHCIAPHCCRTAIDKH